MVGVWPFEKWTLPPATKVVCSGSATSVTLLSNELSPVGGETELRMEVLKNARPLSRG